jgi:galactonate dehydratase
MPNFLILEFSFGEVPWRAELVDPPEQIAKGGMLTVADRPGLGLKINEKVAARYKAD